MNEIIKFIYLMRVVKIIVAIWLLMTTVWMWNLNYNVSRLTDMVNNIVDHVDRE